jgi:hypothetical protein
MAVSYSDVTRLKSGHPVRITKMFPKQAIYEPCPFWEPSSGDEVVAKINGLLGVYLVASSCLGKGCLLTDDVGKVKGWTHEIYGKRRFKK